MPDPNAVIASARTNLHEAMVLQTAGNLPEAEARFRLVVEAGYRSAEVLPILAGLTAQRGALEEAVGYWDALLSLDTDHPVALHEKSLLLDRLGRAGDAVVILGKACEADPQNVVAANNHAVMLSRQGRTLEALSEWRRAADIEPDNIQVRHQMRRLCAEQVPFWHIPMMNDTRRNDAFEAAIVAAIESVGPQARVLDIGTGSGLLSMMAARAGASTVVACEAVPIIADMAQKIIAENGFANRVTVHSKMSIELEVGAELDQPADILVSEILSSDLLTEAVLDTFEDAHARLLKPDAIVIPRAASAIGCLVESPVLDDYVFVDKISGFNVSRFSQFAAMKLPIHGTMTDWKRLSADVELVRVDLTQRRHESDLATLSIPVMADGNATGVVQWMHVDLAEGVAFDNHPDDYTDGGWLQILHHFPHPIAVRAGETLDLAVGHDRITLIIQPRDLKSHAVAALAG
jgi:type II protein arginine methyltransferase